MKKTIAKIMAAAMVLSAVPAVALPSLTVKAADNREYSDIVLKVDGTAITMDAKGGTSATSSAFTAYDTLEYDAGSQRAVDSIADKTITTNITLGGDYTLTNSGAGITHYTATPSAAKYSKEMSASDASSYFSVDVDTSGDNDEFVKDASFNSSGYLVVTLKDSTAVNTALASASSKEFTVPLVISTKTAYVDSVLDDRDGIYYSDDASITLKLIIGNTISTTTTYWAVDDNNVADVEVRLDSSGNATIVKDQYKYYSDADLTAQKGETLDISYVNVNSVAYPVTKIEARAFKGCKFKKIIAENVKHINSAAFRKCKQVKNVNLGTDKMIRKIHSKAFYDCKKLANIKLDGRKLKAVGSQAFQGVKSNCTIKVKGSKSYYNKAVKLLKKGVKSTKVKFARVS